MEGVREEYRGRCSRIPMIQIEREGWRGGSESRTRKGRHGDGSKERRRDGKRRNVCIRREV